MSNDIADTLQLVYEKGYLGQVEELSLWRSRGVLRGNRINLTDGKHFCAISGRVPCEVYVCPLDDGK